MATRDFYHHHNEQDSFGRDVGGTLKILGELFQNFIKNVKRRGIEVDTPEQRLLLIDAFTKEVKISHPRLLDIADEFYESEIQKIKLK